jgi:hypothetical protein
MVGNLSTNGLGWVALFTSAIPAAMAIAARALSRSSEGL